MPCFNDRRIVDQNRTLDSPCPTPRAKIGLIINASGKPERAESVGDDHGREFPAERKPGEGTSCLTCTPVSKKCMTAPGLNCPTTADNE